MHDESNFCVFMLENWNSSDEAAEIRQGGCFVFVVKNNAC